MAVAVAGGAEGRQAACHPHRPVVDLLEFFKHSIVGSLNFYVPFVVFELMGILLIVVSAYLERLRGLVDQVPLGHLLHRQLGLDVGKLLHVHLERAAVGQRGAHLLVAVEVVDVALVNVRVHLHSYYL